MLHSKLQVLAFSLFLLIFITLPVLGCRHQNNLLFTDNSKSANLLSLTSIRLNKNADKFVRNYIHKNTALLVKVKQRSRLPFMTIDKVFKKYKLPVELKYLAVVESELKPTALSNVGAAGPWQLMPATAKLLGLKITALADERTQYNASTKAAALYLRDLYTEFDDWLLVIAAYNCGPGPVYTAIHKSGSRNFWKLQAFLPGESREHVKKFIATHYYFEGQGSITTLTKAEHIKYCNQMAALAAEKQVRNYAAMISVHKVMEKPDIERSIAYGL